MATASSAKRLEDGLSCSLCHKYFTEPVSIDCGHSFCQACITQQWEKWDSDFSCPRCGGISLKRKFRPNKELETVVEIAKRMKVEMAESVSGEVMCETHQEPLKLFCKEEQKLMCSTCTESKDLTTQAFVPIEEAAREYKEDLESLMQAWREKREKAFNFHTDEKNRCKEFLAKLDIEKQKIISKFEEVHKFLKQQEKNMLEPLEALVKEEEEFFTKLSGEICLIDTLIREMEEQSQQPPGKFLQNIAETLSRYKVWDLHQTDICSELEDKLHAFSKKYIILQESLRIFTDFLPQQLKVKWVKVTLDPDTAHTSLNISADQKTLSPANPPHNLIDYPQRFSSSSCVLGCEGFTSGKHYWEVKVGSQVEWTVGVARESLKRKGYIQLSKSLEGIWAVSKENDCLTDDVPKTIGVYLDYDRNSVKFFDADVGKALHTFQSASFNGEKIRPFFWLRNHYSIDQECWIQLCS